MGFVINNEIKDAFDDIRNIASILSRTSVFDQGISIEDLVDWEKNNVINIPELYKSWLSLTSHARIMDGRIELFFPEISSSDKEDVYIGSLGYGTEDLYFSKNTGAFYTIGDDKEEYEDFLDFLTYVQVTMEDEAEEEYGDEWIEIFNEKFNQD